MREVGEAMGVTIRVCYNAMDEPIGCAVGNALEVAEAIDILRGRGPRDVRELVLSLASEVSQVDATQLGRWLDDGTALGKFRAMVASQGGDAASLDRFEEVHRAPVIREIRSPASGVVTCVDAETVGRACIALGAGRSRADDAIDPAVGFDRIVKVGAAVQTGDLAARVHARDDAGAIEAEKRFLGGFACE